MSKFYNASQAAKRIGISDRTIRRWLKPDKRGKVKLASTRTESGQLAIAVSDVERLRLEVEEERTQFDTPTRTYAMPRQATPTHDIDTLTARLTQLEHQLPEITVLTRELGKWQAKVDVQAARIAELERRITEQEEHINDLRCYIAEVEARYFLHDTLKSEKPQISPTPTDLPPGTLHSSEFADQLGLKRTVFDSMMKNGIAGEPLERTRIPIAARPGKHSNYFMPSEQEKAIELLKKHNKIK